METILKVNILFQPNKKEKLLKIVTPKRKITYIFRDTEIGKIGFIKFCISTVQIGAK